MHFFAFFLHFCIFFAFFEYLPQEIKIHCCAAMNFIEIDRTHLETVGFKKNVVEKKDKNGNLKVDETGNPILQDDRHDYNNAIKSLRRTQAFVEGKSFEDPNAHFVIKKVTLPSNHQWGGPRFKLSIWIREDMLDKWIEIAKHSPHFTKTNGQGLVYFIHEEGDFKRFKIGYTTRISERLLSLQTGNPDLLVVYKTIKNVTKKKETQLHQLFAQYRIRGEWFAISPDMIDQLFVTV